MTAIVCIEIDYQDEALATAEFGEIEKDFVAKTQGLIVSLAKPKIYQDKSKIMVEIDLQQGIIARLLLPVFRQEICKGLVKKCAEQGRTITAKCYLKKEAK